MTWGVKKRAALRVSRNVGSGHLVALTHQSDVPLLIEIRLVAMPRYCSTDLVLDGPRMIWM